VPQTKINLTQPLAEFLAQHKKYGFKNKGELVRTALLHYQHKIEQQQLRESAALYAEIYDDDPDLQALTDHAAEGWPQ